MTLAGQHQNYRPRRATKDKWLVDAPEYVLDCFYRPTISSERKYTVFLCGDNIWLADQYKPHSPINTMIDVLHVTETGDVRCDTNKARDAQRFRYFHGKKRVAWADLPQCVRDAITDYMED